MLAAFESGTEASTLALRHLNNRLMLAERAFILPVRGNWAMLVPKENSRSRVVSMLPFNSSVQLPVRLFLKFFFNFFF